MKTLCLTLMLVAQDRGSVVVLEGGGVVSGVAESNGSEVVVRVDGGELRIPQAEVARIESSDHPLSELRRRRSRLSPGVEARARLARWAERRGLSAEARKLWREVLTERPDHAEARRAVGEVQQGGAWIEADEARRQRGEVRYGGVWMSSEAAEAGARSARAAVARAEAEAEERARSRPDPAPAPRPAASAGAGVWGPAPFGSGLWGPAPFGSGLSGARRFGVPTLLPGQSRFPISPVPGGFVLGLRGRSGQPGAQVVSSPPASPSPPRGAVGKP